MPRCASAESHAPTIVVLDARTLGEDVSWEAIASLGELRRYDSTEASEILERARTAEILLVNKIPLRSSTLAALPALRYVSVLATGHDVVDSAAAAAAGIPVSNVPEYGTESVAEHTLALFFALARGAERHDAAIRDGEWGRRGDFSFWLSPQVELAGRCLGLVGFGRIGQRVAELAHALGMQVIAHSPGNTPTPPWPDFAWVELDELFARADIVSLHCPLTPSTHRLVDARRLALLKPGAWLVNTARGALVDEDALCAALADPGRELRAALDVGTVEPLPDAHPLLRAPRLLLTPHMAWSSLSARRRLLHETALNLRAFLEGAPRNVINGR